MALAFPILFQERSKDMSPKLLWRALAHAMPPASPIALKERSNEVSDELKQRASARAAAPESPNLFFERINIERKQHSLLIILPMAAAPGSPIALLLNERVENWRLVRNTLARAQAPASPIFHSFVE